MRLKGLVLPGYACTSQIWHSVRDGLDATYDISWMDYPHDLLGEFHTVDAFACWLHQAIQPVVYDFVIGHSMGGLVALSLAEKDAHLFRRVILVETFLTPPTPFFQNLFLRADLRQEERMVLEMLEREKERYSPRLRETLRQVDTSQLMANLSAGVQALYGDRGCGEANRVLQELGWSQELQQRVTVSVVSNACHFPMVENPGMTARLLQDILA